jgi:glucose/arabinose dehydrogenase/PKD repeat protein
MRGRTLLRWVAMFATTILVAASLLAIPAGERVAEAATLPPGFQESIVFSGLASPMAVEFASDGRVFVAEKSGLIKVFDNLTDTTPTIFADLNVNVFNYWDRGLMDIALDPQFPANPYVYVLYAYDHELGSSAPPPRWGTPGVYSDTCPTPPGPTDNGCVVSGRLSRLHAEGNVMTGPEQVLVEDWCQQFQSHSLGGLAFGADGALYVTSGEAAHTGKVDYGQFGDPLNPCGDPPVGVGGTQTKPTAQGGALRSQDLRTMSDPVGLDGTLLRIDPATGLGLPGNPLAGSADLNARRIVGYGLRNPFRFTVRPGTSEAWISDVGWGAWEEINRLATPGVEPMRNYGWPCFEGAGRQTTWDGLNFDMCENLYAEAGAVTSPYFTYAHNTAMVPGDTCSTGSSATTGLAFYQGGSYPASYDDALFFGDYGRDCIYVMFKGANGLPDPASVAPFVSPAANPVDLKIGPAGDLFYVDIQGGTVRRIRYTDGNQPPTAVATATPTSGGVPLTVQFNASGSSDPDPGDTISFDWDLNGDGTFGDSTSPTPQYTYTVAGSYTAQVRVTDNHGAASLASVVVSAGNTPPSATIDVPLSTTTWKVNDQITFSGGATDQQDGDLPPSALTWSLVMQHCPSTCHQHAIQTFDGVSSGSFVAPDHEYPSYLELRLTATDSGGLQDTKTVRLDPQTTTVSWRSEPSGLSLTVGASSQVTPFDRQVIVGSTTTVDAASPQTLGGQGYEFASWSDGGARSHDVLATASPATYTATFNPTATSGPIVVEAESPSGNITRAGHTWTPRTDKPGYAGDSFMRNEPDNGALVETGYTTGSPELQYNVQLSQPGTYYVWLRGFAANTSGDSLHVGMDGQAVATADRMTMSTYNAWEWFKTTMDGPPATLAVAAGGQHAINVWMREDGFRLDRVLLTTDPNYVPTGVGPPVNTGSNPVPVVTDMDPVSANAGGPAFTLSVSGSGFVNGSVVNWNGSARPTTYVSSTSVTAAISAADIATAGSATVTVVNPAPGGGTSSGLVFTINDIPPNPAPTLSGLSPSSAQAGSPGLTLTVNGSNFVSGTTVQWNGAARTTSFVSSGQLTASIPASDLASAGTAQVTVVNPAPGGGTSNAQGFTITPSNVLFSDDFEDEPVGSVPSGWTATGGGTWAVAQAGSKIVEQTAVTAANLELCAGSLAWTDYTVRAAARAPSDASYFGILGRHHDANNTYMLVLKNGNTWQFGKRVNGTFTSLALGTFAYTPGSWYTLELGFSGTTITVKINGQVVRTLTDASFTSGNVGFRTNALTAYDDVTVTAMS